MWVKAITSLILICSIFYGSIEYVNNKNSNVEEQQKIWFVLQHNNRSNLEETYRFTVFKNGNVTLIKGTRKALQEKKCNFSKRIKEELRNSTETNFSLNKADVKNITNYINIISNEKYKDFKEKKVKDPDYALYLSRRMYYDILGINDKFYFSDYEYETKEKNYYLENGNAVLVEKNCVELIGDILDEDWYIKAIDIGE